VQKMQEAVLDMNREGDLYMEIGDIIDELSAMIQIKIQEEEVAKSFVQQVRRLIQPTSSNIGVRDVRGKRPSRISVEQHPGRPYDLGSSGRDYPTDEGDLAIAEYDSTMSCAADLLESIRTQLLDLGSLRQAAERTSAAVRV
jgi:hypothetical protein